MFKYFWILILAIVLFIFMAYTAYVVRAFSVEHKNEFEGWGDLFSTFDDEHGILFAIWGVIIIGAIFVLFITSVAVYCNSID